jgi:hypothetical protein
LLLLASFGARKLWGQQPVPVPGPAPRPIQIPVPKVRPIEPVVEPEVDVEVPEPPEVDVPEVEVPEPPEPPEVEIEAPELEPVDIDVDVDVKDDADVDVNVDEDDHDFNVHDEENIQKSFSLPAGQRTLNIDNIWGSIEVIADATDKVDVTVHRTNRAESKQALEKAKKDVTLDISQDEGFLKLYVNGPFRCQCDDCHHRGDDDGYTVKMDFQVHVPRDIDLRVKTVNEGHVTVRGTNGNFSVRNVNGNIEMENVSGSGTARTVNGPVKVSFVKNPHENSDFKTVNGNVELKFAHDLSADFRFKTFNGGIYSDFPVTARPVQPMEEEHRGAKVIYRADRYTEARVNAGGPQIQIENLNGDIRILENHE